MRRTSEIVHFVLLRGEKRPSESEEAVSDGAKGRVMVETSPGSAFVVVEANLLLHLLVVAFDAPPQLRQTHQLAQRRGRGQRREPESRRRVIAHQPLRQQPLLFARRDAVL